MTVTVTTTGFGVREAEALLKEAFAPWVQDLGICFDRVAEGEALLRIPASERLHRSGGTICGQAIMAAADTSMVFAIASALGGFKPMTTVGQSTSFLRPAADAALQSHARVIRLGRTLVYGEVTLYTDTPDKPVAHVTSTYIFL